MQELVHVTAVLRQQGDADAGVHAQLDAVDVVGVSTEPIEQVLGDGCGLCLVGQVREQDRELVTAQAGHHVGGSSRAAQRTGYLGQHAVPGRVPQRVVDRLETVEVQHEQCGVASVTRPGISDGQAGVAAQRHPVPQAGQGIVERLVLARQQAPAKTEQHTDQGYDQQHRHRVELTS